MSELGSLADIKTVTSYDRFDPVSGHGNGSFLEKFQNSASASLSLLRKRFKPDERFAVRCGSLASLS